MSPDVRYSKLGHQTYSVVGTDIVVSYSWVKACGYLWVATKNGVRVGLGATRSEATAEALAVAEEVLR